MVTMLMVPAADENDRSSGSSSVARLSAFSTRIVEPVGRWFESYCARKHDRSQSSLYASESSDSDDDDSTAKSVELVEEIDYLRNLDPKEWKEQDHYAVLGLRAVRYKASDQLIKKAYRKIVLTHHPDKRRSAGEKVADIDHDYYTCITKANEILGNPAKRRSYDSIDPEFDDSIPPSNNHSKENFFEEFKHAFELNERWSNKTPVPKLGDMSSTFEEVDTFYSFWYNFDSWREFSYMDEEEKEKGENRDERRWIEKQNRAARQKRKKEEMARIRQLTDNAYACDPRIQKFKDEEKQKKLAQKRARQDAIKAKADEEERKRQEIIEAERILKEKEEGEARAQAEVAKKAKEVTKKALKKERKTLRTLCKGKNYFGENESEVVTNMEELDKLCELQSLESLEALNKILITSDVGASREAFLSQVRELNARLEKEKEELFLSTHKSSNASTKSSDDKQWSHDDMQLLIKAVNLFPAGTNQRWEVVSNYLNQHSTTGNKHNAKQVLAKAKSLNKLDPTVKEEANKQAYNKFEKSQKPVDVKDESDISERFDTPAEQQGLNPAPWTADEQRLLEQALKTYPSTKSDRWECISSCIPGRTKKDCMKRYKDLVEMVKAKKAAQAPAKTKK